MQTTRCLHVFSSVGVRVALGGPLIMKPGGAAFTPCTVFSFFGAPFTLLDCPSTLLGDLALGLSIFIPG